MPWFEINNTSDLHIDTDVLMDVDEFIQRLKVGYEGWELLRGSPRMPNPALLVGSVHWWVRADAKAFIEWVQE